MANKAIFLDRDDTLIEDPGYINHPDQVKLVDGISEALKELRELDYELIVVSNQSGVARGIVTEKALGEIHDRLKQLLAEKGAYLDQIYYCPYHPEGVIPEYRKDSDWRKPNPGMILAAANEMNLDLSRSWCIGNSNRDIEAGSRAGCKTILVSSNPSSPKNRTSAVMPDFTAVNIKEAVNIIKKNLRSVKQRKIWTDEVAPGKVKHSSQITASQSSEDISQPRHAEVRESSAKLHEAGSETEFLLKSILEQLKNIQRTEMFNEFSVTRLIAGIVQIMVLFCLIITIWLLMSPSRQVDAVLISLGFAAVLQIMALTFYTMQSRK